MNLKEIIVKNQQILQLLHKIEKNTKKNKTLIVQSRSYYLIHKIEIF